MIPVSIFRACSFCINRFFVQEQKYGFLWQEKKEKQRRENFSARLIFAVMKMGGRLAELSTYPGKIFENR
jgi:hypothetical protein